MNRKTCEHTLALGCQLDTPQNQYSACVVVRRKYSPVPRSEFPGFLSSRAEFFLPLSGSKTMDLGYKVSKPIIKLPNSMQIDVFVL